MSLHWTFYHLKTRSCYYPEAPEKLWELLETLSRDEEGKFDGTVSEGGEE